MTEGKAETLLETAVYRAIGQASMCWTQTPRGIFKSEEADKIGKKLLEVIRKEKDDCYKQGKQSVTNEE